MGIAPHPSASSTVARPGRSGLEEEIARAETRFARQRLSLWLRAMLGLDTRRARDRLHRIVDRLACLHYRRQSAPRATGTASRA